MNDTLLVVISFISKAFAAPYNVKVPRVTKSTVLRGRSNRIAS